MGITTLFDLKNINEGLNPQEIFFRDWYFDSFDQR